MTDMTTNKDRRVENEISIARQDSQLSNDLVHQWEVFFPLIVNKVAKKKRINISPP